MAFPLPLTLPPMEAKLVDALPTEPGWQFEPKWDGFRCLAFKDGDTLELMSKSGKPLSRYFPEVVADLLTIPGKHFVIDGELVITQGDTMSFDALQARLHPAASRILRLSVETPATLIAFDCLAADGKSLTDAPLTARRAALERLAATSDAFRLSPYLDDAKAAAEAWLTAPSAAIDGVIAKRTADPYRSGERAMLKIKRRHTIDCVIGGFRVTEDGKLASLLLGLYNDAGLLDHIGFVASLPPEIQHGLQDRLQALVAAPGFTGKSPSAPSRWTVKDRSEWRPLEPDLVAEIS